MFNPDDRKRDYNELVEVLENAGAVFKANGRDFKCPFHEDSNPSAWVRQNASGFWKFKCFRCEASGTVWDAQAEATGVSVSRLMSEARAGVAPARQVSIKKRIVPQERKEKPTFATFEELDSTIKCAIARYRYEDAEGILRMMVYRVPTSGGGKAFWQATQREDGRWILENHLQTQLLYNLPAVMASPFVVVTEGEKASDALIELGICATTSPMGKGNADDADWSPLAGKIVYIWRDFDDDGLIYQNDVSKLLEQLNPKPSVRVVYVEGLRLNRKDDAYNFIQATEGTIETKKAAVREALRATRPTGLVAEFDELIDAIEAGKLQPIEWPWRVFNDLVKFSTPGTVSLLVGAPGSRKSFGLMEAVNYWFDKSTPFSIFELEDKRRYHALRAISQRMAMPQLLDFSWCRENVQLMREIRDENEQFLSVIGSCMDGEAEEQATNESICDWVQARAESGSKIIVVDPITAAAKNLKPWVEDGKMIHRLKDIAMRHDANITIVAHPRKGWQQIGMDELSGGAAYSQLFQSIAWIDRHKESKQDFICTNMGTAKFWHDTTLHILKTRMSQGQGVRIAMDFDRSLTFREMGIITSEKNAGRYQHWQYTTPTKTQPIEDTYNDGDESF